MNLPFTSEEFFSVFARYNETVWPMQLVLNALALVCIGLLFRPSALTSRAVSFALSFLWAWMAIAYHFAFFSSINPAAWLFGAVSLLGSLAFAWFGVVRTQLFFRPSLGVRGMVGATLVVFALVVYPAIGYLIGRRYPSAPTFGLPCPTTIFTLGLLLFVAHPVPRLVLVVPMLWVAVGSLAAFQFGVLEDLALLAAGVMAIVVMWFWPAPPDPLLNTDVREEAARAS